MSQNKFKIGTSRGNRETEPSSGVFSGMERYLKIETYFEEGFPVKYLPKIFFGLMLILFYISNTHYAEKGIRKINRLQTEVEDLRADYTTLKAELMFAGKQSEVARKVKPLGLKESVDPPYKIVVKKSEY